MNFEELEEHLVLEHEANITILNIIKEAGQVVLKHLHDSLHAHGVEDHTHEVL